MAIAKNDNWIRRFEVTDPRKHKNGFTIYKVTSVVFPKSAPEAFTRIVVWKRYNDFKKLHKTLKMNSKQWNVNENFPKICKEKFFKRFEERVIKDRICFAVNLLNFIGRHQGLFTSDAFLQFFNSGYQISDTLNGTSEISESERNVDFSTNFNQDGSTQSNGSASDLLDSKSSSESTSVTYDCSDEESLPTLDTPGSLSPTHSSTTVQPAKEKFQSRNDHSSGPSPEEKTPFDDTEKFHVFDVPTQVSDVSNETCPPLCISEDDRVPDILLPPSSSDSETWLTPPDTPAGAVEDYLVQAAFNVSQAQKFEIEGEFQSAFSFYKTAVGCLLGGVREDEDSVRRKAVKLKAHQYLQRAEKIYGLHLAADRVAEPKKITDALEELKLYKVLRVIDSVMVVTNTTDEKCYVIKVLQKSPCPVDGRKKTTIPYNVPYMVKLHKYFENENSIFLVLQYAAGGKLWDQVSDPSASRYLRKEKERGGYYSCSSCESQNDLTKLGRDTTKMDGNNTGINAEEISNSREAVAASSVRNEEMPSIRLTGASEDEEVTNLLANSQRLLSSVSKTLEMSEKLTNAINMELLDMETAFDLNCRLAATKRPGESSSSVKTRRKRSKSKLDKYLSFEDLRDSRPRTASSSIDRRTEWMTEDLTPRMPESVVRTYAAEIVVALETLHRYGVVCRDLRPDNILLDDRGNVLLTYQANWKGVDALVSEEAITGLYAAPENLSVFPITPAVDWWSFGALLHELLTGKTLFSCYPEGIFGHTVLTFPDFLSPEACSLLTELLKYEPGERLGSSVNGADDVKCHPFFNVVDWQLVYDNC